MVTSVPSEFSLNGVSNPNTHTTTKKAQCSSCTQRCSCGARLWCDVLAAATNAKPAPRVTQARQARRRSLSLYRRRRAVELAARARRAMLVLAGPLLTKDTAPKEGSLFRRVAVVRRASCGLQRQVSAVCHGLRSLSLGRRSIRACCLLRARVPTLAMVGVFR